MQRYFIPSDDWHEDKVIIKEADAHHISHVMRMKEGNRIICNNSNGQAAICKITSINKDRIETVIENLIVENKELPISITISQGIPKGDKFDLILQKGTELGASAFIPLQTERSIAQWDNEKFNKKKIRFEKIVKEASEQSHRNVLPIVHPVMSLDELLKEGNNYDFKLFPYEETAKGLDHKTFSNILSTIGYGTKVLICIGPEGGFSENEAKLLIKNDFHPIRIGPRILRAETASMYVLSSFSFHFEE